LGNSIGRRPASWIAFVVAAAALLVLPALALAHLERPSYWPDPRPDKSVSPPAGGDVPEVRTLKSAATGKGPGEVRVVCKGNNGGKSLSLLNQSLRQAKSKGFKIRPSEPKLFYSKKKAKKMRALNEDLARECKYSSIQEAVFDSGNNDRVVVMPGRYTEPNSRKQPVNDPACADLVQDNGRGGMAPSYKYQVTCPNDQNLIYVQGRAVPDEPAPVPPLEEREGIPDEGKCVRCNLQLEGSGVMPTDVIMDAGMNYNKVSINSKPGQANDCNFMPECSYAKDVVLRVDRADGFVARNFLTKSSTEHGIYIEEVDGYRLDKTKMFWSAEYGNLTFTSDHGLYTNCDSYGAGDAALYPGASPESGEGVEDNDFYPDAPRINTVIRKCDMRSSALAYSGSQGNAVRITKSDIYANTAGIVTDSISAGGHPGYPPDSNVIDNNVIYSNNLDSFREDTPFVNTVGLPIGVGTFYPGVNKSVIRDNYIFDNWRRGTMLVSIPSGTERGEIEDPSTQGSCPVGGGNAGYPTSCQNEYHGNVMGVAPEGFKPSPAVDKFGNPHSLDDPGVTNGVDFWWDEAPTEGNCWHDNVGPDGTRDSLNTDPPIGPAEGQNVSGFLPEACDPSDPSYPAGIGGPGYLSKVGMLLACGEAAPSCEWFMPPSEPGSAEARRAEREAKRAGSGLDNAAGAVEQLRFQSMSTIAERR
jgi:hypothetical protein